MWDFSDDEWLALAAAAAVSLAGAWRWYAALLRVRSPRAPLLQRAVLAVTPPFALALLYATLRRWADPVQVAGRADYLALFMTGGAAVAYGVLGCLPLAGLSARDDAIERANPAAVAATAGAVLGVTLAYAGGNVGYGPTVWTTFVPALLAVAGLFLMWVVLEAVGGAAEAVTVDRDPAAGVRLAAFLVCGGAVLGRAAAGDWEGWEGMFADFAAAGWPAAGLVAIGATANRLFRPTPARPRPAVRPFGVLPALVMVAAAVAFLVSLGPPKVTAGPAAGRTPAGRTSRAP